jgi:hypothetical protein
MEGRQVMVRKLCTILGCGVVTSAVVLALTIGISAQNTTYEYVIPHFSGNAGSELLISNLSGNTNTANPDISLRDSGSGQLAETVVAVPPGTQQRLTAGSFGLSGFDGSVVVKSAVPLGVTATVAAGPGVYETVAALGGALTSSNQAVGFSDSIIPFAQGTTGQMRLTVFNPNNNQVNVVVTAVAAGGLIPSSGGGPVLGGNNSNGIQAAIPAFGTFKQDIGGDPRDIAYLLIHVSASIFGSPSGVFAQAEMINFSDPAQGISFPASDFSAVRALPLSDATKNGTIAYFSQSGNFVTELEFVNTSSTAGAVSLTGFDLLGNTVTGRIPNVPANGAARQNIQTIFGGNAPVEGSITFNSTTPVIATELITDVRQGGFVLMPLGPQPDFNFVFSVRNFDPQFFLRLNLLDLPGQPAATITLRYVSDDGTPNSIATFTLDPSDTVTPAQEATALLGNLMPEAQRAGFIHISSSQKIIATAFEGAMDNSMLAALPAIHPDASYTPPDPTTYLISGTVLHVTPAFPNGKPLPGASVPLIRPISVNAITDQNGAFTLPALQQPAPGDYTLTVSAAGYTFSPSSKTITISTASGSSRNNVFAATLVTPVITSVQPGGMVAASGSTTITIIGSPLLPNGQIIFDGQPLATTLAAIPAPGARAGGPAQTIPVLQASVDASALINPRTASVVVQTNGPAGSAQSQPFPVGIGTAAPVLSGFGTLPSPLIAGNPGVTTTINGTGFIQGQGLTVQIGILSGGVIANLATLTQGAGVTYKSATSIQVTIPAQYLAVGRVLKVTATNPPPTIGPSNALDLPVFNPVPVITSISPDHGTVQSEPNSPGITTFVVNGFGFKPGATINFGGTVLQATFNSSISLTSAIPQQQLQVGAAVPVFVVNPDPSVGPSGSVPFSLLNLVPLLTSVEPVNGPLSFDNSRANEGYAATLLARGSNFEIGVSVFETISLCGAVAIAPNSTTLQTAQQQQFIAYLDGALAPAGSITWAVNQVVGGTSATGTISANGLYTAPFTVPNPPTVIVTAFKTADMTKFANANVTISATPPNGTASSGGASVGVTIISSHEAVLTTSITCAGTYQVDVRNPQPGGGVSPLAPPLGTEAPVQYTVVPYSQAQLPKITSFAPSSITPATDPSGSFPLTITGTNFEASPKMATVSFGNTVLFPTSVTSTSINVNVPNYLISEAGFVPVVVTNPDAPTCVSPGLCGTGSSNRVLFPVFPSAAPVVTAFNPPTAPGLNTSFSLTITGANFETSPAPAVVIFGGYALLPTSLSPTSITVYVPGYLITQHGANFPVVVVNPDTGPSNTLVFPVF